IARAFEARHGRPLDVERAVVELVVSAGFSEQYGVRQLRRALEDLVEKPLSSIGQERWSNWPAVSVHVREGKIEIGPPQEVDDGATL
ncbi:MAG: hypothetical protein HY815_27745, partial [Candidatus Riflebacteria bacterium]|nr:hypothetical protein [Candidatus Riflebacteria bacterium]